jgi:hypothetical protein
MSQPTQNPPQPSVWTEYAQSGARIVLRGVSFFFSSSETGKQHEVNLFENISVKDGKFSGEIDVRRACDVMEKAMAPLKTMYRKLGLVTAALFFAGRILSILPFIPSICYLLGTATLVVTRDMYMATRYMKEAHDQFSLKELSNVDRMNANEAISMIDINARRSVCDLFLPTQEDHPPSTLARCAQHNLEGEECVSTIHPLVVTHLFFPPLAFLATVQGVASHFVPSS